MGVSARSSKSPWIALFLGLLLCTFVVGSVVLTPSVAQAQDEEKKDEAGPKEQRNLFTHIVMSAGIFFGPLLLLVSICLVALIVLLAMDLRMSVAVPPGFVDDFTDMVNKRQFKQAFDLCKEDSSYLGRVMAAGMGRLQYGIDDARLASQNMVDSVKAGKEQLIAYVATIGTLGPMLGLVGTVYGMILSFMELSAGGTPKPEKLADGISHALVITLLGVALSVPAIFSHAFFKNRLVRISMDASTLSDDLLTQMYYNSKKAPTGPALPSTAVQPVPVNASAKKAPAPAATMSMPAVPPPPPGAGPGRPAE